jgi:hypothetical protein
MTSLPQVPTRCMARPARRHCAMLPMLLQARLSEVEERLAAAASEAEGARGARAALEARFEGAKTAAEVGAMVARLEAAETALSDAQNDYSSLLHRAKART